MDEAKSLCKDEVPSVFTLVSLLENEETIKSAVETKDQMSFSYDEDLVPAGLEEAEKQAGNSDRFARVE